MDWRGHERHPARGDDLQADQHGVDQEHDADAGDRHASDVHRRDRQLHDRGQRAASLPCHRGGLHPLHAGHRRRQPLMRSPVELRGKQERSFHSRPTDPVWASTSHLAAVRARLAQFDPRVTVWWAGNRQRWRLMEWSNRGGFWRPVCFWEGPGNTYREADGESMVTHLGRMSVNARKLLADIEAHNAKVDAEKGREFREANKEYLRDTAKMHFGRDLLVSANPNVGGPRKRNWFVGERGGSHRRMVRDHLIQEWEARNGRKWEGPGS